VTLQSAADATHLVSLGCRRDAHLDPRWKVEMELEAVLDD